MKFIEFEREATALVSAAISNLGLPETKVETETPKNETFGDLSTSVSMRIAKSTGRDPFDVAKSIADRTSIHITESRYVESVLPDRTGYINFRLNYSAFAPDTIHEILSSDRIGEADRGRGSTVAIEHTNVNPNKALHIGHARNLVLGDSIARIMRHAGYRVQVLNYIDDSGAQVADIIVGFKYLGLSDRPPEGMKFDSYCGDRIYVRVNQEYSKDPSLKERQSFVLREIERGEGEIAQYTNTIVNRILADQLKTCWRLGASYDLLNWESHIVHSGLWSTVFEQMKARGLTYLQTEGENSGCWVFKDPETGNEKVLVRSDGTAVYVAKDIPYAAWKIGLIPDPFGYSIYVEKQPGDGPLWTTSRNGAEDHPKFGSADIAISVIDTKQSYLQRIISKVLEGLRAGSGSRYIHRAYDVVALSRKTASQLGADMAGEFVHMSGRKGLYVNVDAALDSLRSRALEETKKRNPDESKRVIDEISEAIAIAALRYELVKQDPDKIIVFDMEESLKFEGDTGPYLMYTYARARRILEKSGVNPAYEREDVLRLTNPLEKTLVKHMSMLDKAVLLACEYLSPKEVARFAHDLCVKFNMYYETVQVIKEPDTRTRNGRLLLVLAFSRVLRQAMLLLGIPSMERI